MSASVVTPKPAATAPQMLNRLLALGMCLSALLLWFFARGLLASDFLPHWYCYVGNKRLVWTNVLADLVIGISYVVISYTLARLVRRAGQGLPYQSFFWAFGLFIVSCGVTHFMEVVTIWKPVYWLAAAVKVITALASAGTAVLLVIAIPEILWFVRTARESAAREGNEKFRALVEASPLAVFSLDGAGRVTSWNASAERIFGFPAEDVIGHANPTVPPELQQEHADWLQQANEKRALCGLETVRQRANGERIPVNVYKAPLLGADGAVTGIMSMVEDISEAKRMAMQVRQSQKLEVLGRLAGGVAHDFNNMLMVLDGSTELLERSLPPTSTARIYLDQIQRTSTKAAAITKQLLAFSRKQVVEYRAMDLNATLTETEFMLPRLLGSDIELTFRHNATQSWIRSDAAQIEQVVANLAINARDAMPKGGRLVISTRNEIAPAGENGETAPVPFVVLEVADTGTGMDEKTRAQIFEPFFTTKPAGKGTGLGLSTVYGIVTQSGGQIQVHSAVGEGTRFEIRFPVVAPVATVPARQQTKAPVHEGPQATILLADDEEGLRRAVAEILRQSGFTVIEATNGTEALETARKHGGEIDILLTDIVMPGMHGTDLATRAQALRPGMKIILMSGYAEGISETRLPENTQYLQKPFRFSALLDLLQQTLRRN